ncbi:MAG: DUF1569 domain-containing protein [Bacteroidia bacterium]|nr:DUF1569 domain-containing protein [Bacteroidia bacterium]
MSSLFRTSDREAVLARFDKLSAASAPVWGKMTVQQMLVHCQAPLKVATGALVLKHSLIGRLFGKMAKKQLLRPEPFKQNLPTAPEFKAASAGLDFEKEKQALLHLIRKFGEAGPQDGRGKHPFFGAMTEEEWDALQWKHLDHHLRQFGV